MIDSQVVLQCRVQSKVQPSIKWFRKQDQYIDFPTDIDNYNSRVIQYFENKYELLESAGEKELTEDTYLSKLILNNISERDIGVYVCVGINYRGFKLREAYLNINFGEHNDNINNTPSSCTNNFYLLFFIPIGLAIMPVLLWCSYLIIKTLSVKQKLSKQNHKIKRIKSRDDKNYTAVNVK